MKRCISAMMALLMALAIFVSAMPAVYAAEGDTVVAIEKIEFFPSGSETAVSPQAGKTYDVKITIGDYSSLACFR